MDFQVIRATREFAFDMGYTPQAQPSAEQQDDTRGGQVQGHRPLRREASGKDNQEAVFRQIINTPENDTNGYRRGPPPRLYCKGSAPPGSVPGQQDSRRGALSRQNFIKSPIFVY